MKQKLLNIKYKLVAIWWFITRKNYYLWSYNGREGNSLESYNVVLPAFIYWVQKKHNMLTSEDIIKELKEIGTLYKSSDTLAYQMVKDLIEKLSKQ